MASTMKFRLRRLLPIVAVNLGILVGLFVVAEILLHLIWKGTNPFLAAPNNTFRIRDPAYTHTLAPNFDGFDAWGSHKFRIFTNSLGFRDASVREVPLAADRKRVLLIGDSFTESLGVSYEETFVGLFARAHPELDVLNAGVSSYAPSVYYEKLKHFIESGLKFDEAVVYIDISDIQDEATLYWYDQNGVLQLNPPKPPSEDCSPLPRPPLPRPEKGWLEKVSYLAEFLDQLRYSRRLAASIERASVEDLSKSGAVYSRDYARPSWTYSKDATCYGAVGIEGAIDKARERMDRLYELLAAHGVDLSVGVYPWPQQLLYDRENSRQAQIWREWCAGKCRRFFDHFPAFFRYKEQDPDFVRSLFFWGDMHYNARGNQLLAEDLIRDYK